MLTLVVDLVLAGDDLANDFDVLAGAAPGLGVGDAVPAFGDLWTGGAEAEEEAAAGELVDRRAGHRRGRWRTSGHLHDRGAKVDRLRLPGQPGEHADHVGTIGLSRPDRLVADRLGGVDHLEGVLSGRTDAPVAKVESELQCHPGRTLLNWESVRKPPRTSDGGGHYAARRPQSAK